MLRGLRRLCEEEKIFGLKNTDIFFGMLNCIARNSVHLGDMNIKGRKSVYMLFANTFLNEYIKSSSTTIKIYEGMIKRKTYDEPEGRFINIKNSKIVNNKKSFRNLFSESRHDKIRVLEILELEKYIINPYGTLCQILVEGSNLIKIKYADKILEFEEYKRLIKLLKKYKKQTIVYK